MDTDEYSIVLAESGWELVMNGRPIASGMDRTTIDRAAVTAARMSEARGREAVILARGETEPCRSEEAWMSVNG